MRRDQNNLFTRPLRVPGLRYHGLPWRTWRAFTRLDGFVRLLMLVVLIWLVGATVLWLVEHRSNPDFQSVSSAFWNIAVYLFSGLDSGQPETMAGRLVAGAVLVMSAGVVALLTGEIASFLVERRLGRDFKMPAKSMSKHVVICNWNDKGLGIVRELHAQQNGERYPILIVSNDAAAADLPEDRDAEPELYDDVFFIKGDPAKELILERANVGDAHSVIILADPAAGELADAKSILIAMAVNKLRNDHQGSLWICVECLQAQNVEHLQLAGADQVISASEFALKLLCHSARYLGISQVFRDLLTTTGDSNEIYMLRVPGHWHGKTFTELAEALTRDAVGKEEPILLMGVKRGRELLINPRSHEITPLAEDDEAIVLAYTDPPRNYLDRVQPQG